MPLTIQYCSDLHLEFERNRNWIAKYPLKVVGDILLLGGDIMLLAQMEQHNDFLDLVAASYKQVYWIAGNHEYYHSDIAAKSSTMNVAIRDNVFLVNNTTVSIGDTDLVCSTLWSHISPANEWDITRSMADFGAIRKAADRFTVADYNALHEQGRQFIEQAVANSRAKHKIVLTHHLPTFMNYPKKYLGDPLNEAFATEMHDYVATSGISYWLYGHTHSNTPDFTIGNTRLLTNQLGYVQYGENKHFDSGKCFTIG
jgi:predicted phosphohydrolase